MQFVKVFLLVCAIVSCENNLDRINEKKITKNLLTRHPENGKLLLENQLFTGIAINYYPNGFLSEEIHYKDGIKSGLYLKWFADGCIGRLF